MKKVIYAAMALGIAFDVLAMELGVNVGQDGAEVRKQLRLVQQASNEENLGAKDTIPTEELSSNLGESTHTGETSALLSNGARNDETAKKTTEATKGRYSLRKPTTKNQSGDAPEANGAVEPAKKAKTLGKQTPRKPNPIMMRLREELKKTRDEVNSLQEKNSELMREIERTKAEAETTIAALQKKKLELENNLESLQADADQTLRELKEEKGNTMKMLLDAQGAQLKLSGQFRQLATALELDSLATFDQLMRTVTELKQENQGLQNENGGLQEENEKLRNTKRGWLRRLLGW